MKITRRIALATAVAGGLAAAFVAGTGSGTNAPAAAPPPPPPIASAAGVNALTPEAIYKRNAPGVVVITATETQHVAATAFSPPLTERVKVLGSGFVINGRGDILTNDHVVRGGSGILVGLSSGASFPATIVGTDLSSDLAVIHVRAPAKSLHPLAFADSAAVAVGDPVYAIGNPLGLDRTMTSGIISARGRDIKAPNGHTITSAIQTDAAINHGNSGGPLLERDGRVVGVNEQIASSSANGGSIGIGFAISSDTARSVADQLIATGHVEHAWLGAQVETIEPGLARAVRNLPAHGVVVARVLEGSPAAKAGLQAMTVRKTGNGASTVLRGDTIVSVAGTRIEAGQQLANVIAARKPGDRVALTVVRAGKRRTLSVTLGNTPSGA
jgi:S1-C subfamily serine protease